MSQPEGRSGRTESRTATWMVDVLRACVVRVRARQREEVRRAKGHRRVGAGTGKEREGSVREGKWAQKRRR